MIPFYENRAGDLLIFRSENLDFMPHLHAQLELMYVEDGEIENTINGCGKLLKSGDVSITFPNSVHSYHIPTGQPDTHCIVLLLRPDLVADSVNTLLKFHPQNPFVGGGRLHKDVPYVIHALLEEFDRKTDFPACSQVCKAYSHIIVARLLQNLELIANTDGNYYDIIYKTICFIGQNYMQPLSLESVSRALGVGKYYLSRVFSDKIKVGFSDYINGIRVYRARNMLSGTDKNITRIAYDCGFQSIRTFNRAFQKVYNVSPRELRNAREVHNERK